MKNRKTFIIIFLILTMLFSGTALAFGAGYLSVEYADTEKLWEDQILDNTDVDMSDVVFNQLPFTYNVTVFPGVDFLSSADLSPEQIRSEIDSVIDAALTAGMNSITVVPFLEEKAVYTSQIVPSLSFEEDDGSPFDPISYFRERCRERSVEFVMAFSVSYYWTADGVKHEVNDLSTNTTQYLCEQIKEIARNYTPGAVLITDLSSCNLSDQYQEYRQENMGISYETWCAQQQKNRLQALILAGRSASVNTRYGVQIDQIWAYRSEREGGLELESEIPSSFAKLGIDTLDLIDCEELQFALIDTRGCLESIDQPFETIVAWWNEHVSEEDIPLYFTVNNTLDGADEPGWSGADQMARMLIRSREYEKFKGAFFNSLTNLKENKNGSTDILVKVIDETILDAESLFKDLTFYTPKKTVFTTYEDRVLFYGSGDSNFEILINGVPAVTNDEGEFYSEVPLNVGVNLITFEHKGTSVTYKITRNVQLITDVSPSGAITALGGSKITVVATAYRGSSVSATLGGISTTLYEDTSQKTDDGQSVYTTYVGSIRLPAASASARSLGSIVVSVSNKELGLSASAAGGSVTIMAAVVETDDPPVPSDPGTSSGGSSDPSSGGSVISGGTMVQVVGSNVRVYPSDTLDIFSSPDYYTLPAGTIDYIVGSPVSCTYNGVRHTYYILKSGLRIENTDVQTVSGQNTVNSMTIDSITNTGNYTEVTITTGWRVPFTCGYSPLTYFSEGGNDYNVSSFGANTFSVTFYYTGSGNGNTSCGSTPLFSGCKWSVNGTKATLSFTLSSAGEYYGMKAYYNSAGKLVLRFNNAPKPQSASNAYGYTLNGLRIVLDPGHSESEGAINGTIGVREKVINAAICAKTADILRSLGATVTVSSPVNIENKRIEAQSIQPHIYIAIHQNSGSSTAKGGEAYYFNPFSMPLAKNITDQIVGVYSRAGQHSVNRGVGQANYLVTCDSGYAAVLVEYGFISNNTEGTFLAKESTQQAMAEATVRGIINYLL